MSAPHWGTGTLDDAIRVAGALGVAYATYQLIPNPQEQPAFVFAVDGLADSAAVRALEVTSESFRWAGQDVPAQHLGVGRLAARLFLHGVAAIHFLNRPSADDVIGMFDVIRHRADDSKLVNGPSRALEQLGVSTIGLVSRAMLTEADPEDEGDGDPAKTVGGGGGGEPEEDVDDPESFAEVLLRAAGHQSDSLVALVVERYVEAIGMVDPEDVWEREEVVHRFVDTFFYFPRSFQAPLLSEFLTRRSSPEFQWILDQFAHHELQDLAPYLGESGHPLLTEYARIAASARETRLDDYQALITETAPDRVSGIEVESRIERVLQVRDDASPPARQALIRLQNQRLESAEAATTAADIMHGLLGLARTEADVRRRIQIWARKLSAVLESGDLEKVTLWMDSLYTHSHLEVDTDTLTNTLAESMSPVAVVHLADALRSATEENEESLGRIVPFLAEPIIERLGDEPESRRRRTLIDMLAVAARRDATPVVRALDDPRWYLVRNLLLVLSRSQQTELADVVRPLMSHPDARVRREALRALHNLAGSDDIQPFLEAMTDNDDSVRGAARTVIRSTFAPGAVSPLRQMIDGNLPEKVKLEAIELLGLLDTTDTRAVLEELASQRTWGSATRRSIRKAAGKALQEAS